MKLSQELAWRGFVNQTTYKNPDVLDKSPLTFYWGVDPSDSSMTVGNLAIAMMVRHFIAHGHKAVLLVGGATGMIGDPDGKDEERQLKPRAEIEANTAGIIAQYHQIFEGQPVTVVDNYDWFKTISYLDFLRDIGKHFSMTQLLQRDFVQSRIGKNGKGISYAEFSYSLIQGYDFLHLSRTRDVTLQVCGADQWGNSLSGVELIRKLDGKEAHIWSAPIVINKATGKKFGKSENGAVWLDPAKTSPFAFYQFWLNVDDESVLDYLKIYTLLTKAQIEDVTEAFQKNPAERHAQKTLAFEVTKIVHGEPTAIDARKATEALFNGEASEAIPTIEVTAGEHDVIDLIVKAELAPSGSAARRLLQQGGIKLNQKKVEAQQVTIKKGDVLQVGRRNFVKVI